MFHVFFFRNSCKVFCLFICLLSPCLLKCLIFSYPWVWDLLFCWCQSNKIFNGFWCCVLNVCISLFEFRFSLFLHWCTICVLSSFGWVSTVLFPFSFPFNLCISLVIVGLNYDFWIIFPVSNVMANLHLRSWTFSLDSFGIHCFQFCTSWCIKSHGKLAVGLGNVLI